MRKDTYDFEAKRLYRAQLKSFIEKHYPTEIERCNLRVACLPGHEGLEVSEVYLPLGIKPTRIYGIEQDAEAAQELRQRKLGIDVHESSALSFFSLKNTPRFDIINLDFKSQFGEDEMETLKTVFFNERMKNRCIVGTNFYGSRESKERQGEYQKTIDFFEKGGDVGEIARIARTNQREEMENIASVLSAGNDFWRCQSLDDTRDKSITSRLRYMLSANTVQETLDDLVRDPFLHTYLRSIDKGSIPSFDVIRENPLKHYLSVLSIAAVRNMHIMRVFHQSFPHDAAKQNCLHALWEILQLRRPYFIKDFMKGRYVSDTGSPMLYDFLYAENLRSQISHLTAWIDSGEETQMLRITLGEKSEIAQEPGRLRPLTERESIMFAKSNDPMVHYRKGGLFLQGSGKKFWRIYDEVLGAHVNELEHVLAPRNELVVSERNNVFQENAQQGKNNVLKEDLPKRIGYLPQEFTTQLPRTHQKAIDFFVNDVLAPLPEDKRQKIEKAFMRSGFQENLQMPLEETRFYAFFDELRARIMQKKPVTSHVIDMYYQNVRDATSLVESVPPPKKKKCDALPEQVKEEIRQLRTVGFKSKEIYHYLRGKGISIAPRQCGATAAWVSPKLACRRVSAEQEAET